MARKTALVTGAAKRIGREIALFLAKSGYDIVLHYNASGFDAEKTAKEISNLGVNAFIIQADLAKPEDVMSLIANIQAQHNLKLTLLVNNASIFIRDSVDYGVENFSQNMQINFLAPVTITQAFINQADDVNTDYNVINITDASVISGLTPGYLSYSLSKRALLDATLMFAKKYGVSNSGTSPVIRVNAIAPGPTMRGEAEGDVFDKMAAKSPKGKATDLADINNAIRAILDDHSLNAQQFVV